MMSRLQSATLALRCHLHTRLRTTLSALATACVLMAYVVQNFTLVHPFLLADNRQAICVIILLLPFFARDMHCVSSVVGAQAMCGSMLRPRL